MGIVIFKIKFTFEKIKFMKGKIILNYEITSDAIGSGGMAEVYEARHRLRTNEKVAIKILDKKYTQNEQIRKRFLREAKIMVGLDNLYITKVIDYEEKKDSMSIVMEFLKGKDLKDFISQNGAFTEENAIILFIKILKAFDYAHKKGVIHRDIKPSNIFILEDNKTPKILDFGISKLISEDLTLTNTTMGTPSYMSPEQIKDTKRVDKRSDIYSLGVMLYFIIKGKSVYDSTTLTRREIEDYILSMPLPVLDKNTLFINKIIQKATQKNQENRYQNCKEFIEAFGKNDETVVDDESVPQKPSKSSSKDDKSKEKNDETVIDENDDNDETIIDENDETVFEEIKKTKQKKQNLKNSKKKFLYVGLAIVSIVILFFIFNKNEEQINFLDNQIQMVFVKGGTFQMGSNIEDDEKPIHSVTVSDFYIGKYEVTQKLWKEIMGNNPSDFKGDNLPVEKVSWNDIQDFLKKLNKKTGKNFRLPTEAEWEYAARGGNKSRNYKYSGSNNIDDVAWYDNNSDNETHTVGSKKSNELGIYDMSGNVWEWCSDWYDGNYYSKSPKENPTGPTAGSYRVLRGGSWFSSAKSCRPANRNYNTPDNSNASIGFRFAFVP